MYTYLVCLKASICIFQLSEVPDCSLLYSDYLPELSRHLAGYLEEESASGRVSCVELQNMNLPSFRPAFLVLCRVLLNVIHECLKLRLEQRPAGKPSLLSIKQVLTYVCKCIAFCFGCPKSVFDVLPVVMYNSNKNIFL